MRRDFGEKKSPLFRDDGFALAEKSDSYRKLDQRANKDESENCVLCPTKV
jgi:hypothetical protein